MNKLSQKIKNVSVIAMVIVVAIHAPWGGDGVSKVFVRDVVLNFIGPAAVPLFFFFSGYFLARHFSERGWYVLELKKRVRSLFLPYLIICSLYLCFDCAIKGLVSLNDIPQYFGMDFTKPVRCVPLWYLRTLLLLMVAAPLFDVLVRRLRWLFLALLLLGWYMFLYFESYFPCSVVGVVEQTIRPVAMLFFSAGILAGLSNTLRIGFQNSVLMGSWLLAIFLYTISYRDSLMIKFVAPAQVCVVAFAIWSSVPSYPWSRMLTSSTFGIYLFHPFAFSIWYKAFGYDCGIVPCVASIFLSFAFSFYITLFLSKFVGGGG